MLPVEKWNLTRRQEEVLRLMADEALTSKEVAHRLGISYKTVEVHVDRLLPRMGAINRMQAVLAWDRARRDSQAAQHEAAHREEQRTSGFVHCPTCGGAGFVRRAA